MPGISLTTSKMNKSSSNESETFDLEEWKRKRKRTTIGFCIVGLALGMEYAVTFTTLWLYLKTLVKTSHPYIFYSFISASYFVMTIISSLIVSRIVDRYRCVRASFLLCTTIVTIGNIMYSLPFSPYLLLFGRLVAGIGGCMRPLMSGEVARCYSEEEKLGAFSAIGIAFNLGFIVGPGTNFAFVKVDFTLGDLHVTYASIPGFFMALVFIIVLLTEYFLIYDLSKEYDLKENEKKLPLTNESIINGQSVITNGVSNTCFQEETEKCTASTFNSTNEPEVVIAGGRNKKRKRTESFMIMSIEGRSRTYTLDIEDVNHNENQPLVERKNGVKGLFTTTLKLLLNLDVAIICLSSGLFMFAVNSFDMWLPLLVVDVLNWGIVEVRQSLDHLPLSMPDV